MKKKFCSFFPRVKLGNIGSKSFFLSSYLAHCIPIVCSCGHLDKVFFATKKFWSWINPWPAAVVTTKLGLLGKLPKSDLAEMQHCVVYMSFFSRSCNLEKKKNQEGKCLFFLLQCWNILFGVWIWSRIEFKAFFCPKKSLLFSRLDLQLVGAIRSVLIPLTFENRISL